MINSVFCEKYNLPPADYKEIRRYMHAQDTDEINVLIDSCNELSSYVISPRVCFSIFDIRNCGKSIVADCFVFNSDDLCKCLKNCDKLVMFCATIGFDFERLIKKYSVTDKAKAVCLHALGTERVEALCDTFCKSFSDSFYDKKVSLTPRFSPGYGDLNIEVQKTFFELLSVNKNLGVTLTDSYLMSPSKTVTAVFGIKA